MDAPLLSSTRALLAILLLAAPLAAASSCATLETIPENACGNGVLESKRGEDCDGPPANRKHQCGAAGTQHACKYVWEEEGDACPTGYEKSPDKRCRKPSGNFELAATFTANGAAPRLGDFDGDGQVDLATWRPLDSAAISLSDASDGRIEVTSLDGGLLGAFPGTRGDAFAELSDDGLHDLLLLTNGRFSVLRSRDGEPNLKVYPLEQKDDVAYFALPSWALGDALLTEEEDLDLDVVGRLEPTLIGSQPGERLCLADAGCMELAPESLGRVHLLAHSREHWVYAYLGAAALSYFGREVYPASFPPPEETALPLPLPSGHKLLSRPALLDADGDDDVDLVVLAAPESGGLAYVEVLEGDAPASPGGHFNWTVPTGVSPTMRLSLTVPADADPLAPVEWAVGDVNGDGVLDLAYDKQVFVSRAALPATLVPAADHYDVMPWPRSGPLAAGDFNADGLTDFVSSVDGKTEIVFGGDQLPLTHYPLDGVGSPARLGVVDFDGDGADDLFVALSNQPPGTVDCNLTDDLVVAYGRAGSFPEPFESVAALPVIQQLTTGRFRVDARDQPAGPDGMTQRQDNFGDLYVSARCQAEMENPLVETSALSGNPQRAMRAPFAFDHVMGDQGAFIVDAVAAADVIQLDPGDDGHTDVIVFGSDPDQGKRVGLILPAYGDAEIDADARVEIELPPQAQTGLVALASAGPPTAGVAQRLAVVSVTQDTESSQFQWGLIASDFAGAAPQPLEIAETKSQPPTEGAYWRASSLKLVSAQLNDDDVVDFVAIATFSSDDVSSYPAEMGEPDVPPSPPSTGTVVMFLSDGATGYTAQALETDLVSPVDLVVGQGHVLVVESTALFVLDPSDGTLLYRSTPIETTGIQGAVSLDYNDDKLDDLVVVTGSQAQILTQLPYSPESEDDGVTVAEGGDR